MRTERFSPPNSPLAQPPKPPTQKKTSKKVLPAHYAFVLHTASPLTGRRGEIFGELVAGLGESLVANHPGRPLSFRDLPDGSATELLTLPSKRTGLFLPGGLALGWGLSGGGCVVGG